MIQIDEYQKLEKSSKIIDELIFKSQSKPKDKLGVVYELGECSNSTNASQPKKKIDQSKFNTNQKRGF